jgi:hypothetical protein
MNKDKNTRDLMVNFQNRTPHPWDEEKEHDTR